MYITDKGKKVCEELLPSILQIWQDTVEGIRAEEIECFLNTLNKMEENIRKKTIIQV